MKTYNEILDSVLCLLLGSTTLDNIYSISAKIYATEVCITTLYKANNKGLLNTKILVP